jgi:hypothetical protein
VLNHSYYRTFLWARANGGGHLMAAPPVVIGLCGGGLALLHAGLERVLDQLRIYRRRAVLARAQRVRQHAAHVHERRPRRRLDPEEHRAARVAQHGVPAVRQPGDRRRHREPAQHDRAAAERVEKPVLQQAHLRLRA